MITREWVAVHRKHHATCETQWDPHSPQVYGIWRVLFNGLSLYRIAARDTETVRAYGTGTPSNWIEQHVYGAHRFAGLGLMLVVDVLLFGSPGLIIYAVQMLWIPFWAAGVVNGVGHYWGYRNFETPDESRNLIPVGVLIGGEELHNNHHEHAYSAKFSDKWWEFDVGWLYIRLLELAGLAMVKRTARPDGLPERPLTRRWPKKRKTLEGARAARPKPRTANDGSHVLSSPALGHSKENGTFSKLS